MPLAAGTVVHEQHQPSEGRWSLETAVAADIKLKLHYLNNDF